MNEAVVRHNEAAHRFELGSDENPAHIKYLLREGIIDMVHTEVPAEYKGQGLAGKLATAALDWARENGRRVVPTCSFIAGFIDKHPEYRDLLA